MEVLFNHYEWSQIFHYEFPYLLFPDLYYDPTNPADS